MIIQVLLKERINEFDFREWAVPVTCGQGMQPLRWLGHAACARMAYNTGDVPAKYLPQAIRYLGKKEVFHPDKRISEVLQDGAQVEIECSRGPESFTVYWEGKPPPVVKDFFPKEEKKEPEQSNEAGISSENAQASSVQSQGPTAQAPQATPAQAPQGTNAPAQALQGTTAPAQPSPSQPSPSQVNDEGGVPPVEPPPPPPPVDKRVQWANDVIACIDWAKYEFSEDLNSNYDTWEKDCGILQSVLIWYCAKGDEIEDKDFGLLNFEQFRQIFVDTKLCTDASLAALVKGCFDEGLKVKDVPGAYQLSTVEFIPAVVRFVSSPYYEEMVPDRDKQHLSSKVSHLIENFLVPCLNAQVTSELQYVHGAATTGSVCMDVLKENKDLFQRCLQRCKRSDTSVKVRVDFRMLLPCLRKWLALGGHWNPQRASLLIIYAYQSSQNAAEFSPIPLIISLGAKQLRRFLFGASCYAFMKNTSLIKISHHAFLRDFLDKVFKRAGVAKPLYSTYEEKKNYLRSLLIHE